MKDNRLYIIKELIDLVNSIYLQLEVYIEIERQSGNTLFVSERTHYFNYRHSILVIDVYNDENEIIACSADLVEPGEENKNKPILIVNLLEELNIISEDEKYKTLNEIKTLENKLVE